MRIRNDTHADERIEQRALLDKARFRAAEEERRRQFSLDSQVQANSKTEALRRDLERKASEAGSASPAFSVNLGKPGSEAISGGFSTANLQRGRGSLVVPITQKLNVAMDVIKQAYEISLAFNVDERHGYMTGLQNSIRDLLYPGESVRVTINPGEPSGHLVVIEGVNAPSLTRAAPVGAPNQGGWELGSLPYTQSAPRSFTVERKIQGDPSCPVHKVPSEHSTEQYRHMSDTISNHFHDKIF